MDRLEGAGVLDAQAGQRIDVEEAPVVDVAGSKPPVAELVVLALEQMVQRKRRRGAIRPGAIGGEAARDDVGRAGDRFQLGLEARRLLAAGTARPLMPRSQRKHPLAGGAFLRACLLDDSAANFLIPFRRDGQAMLAVPGRKTALATR